MTRKRALECLAWASVMALSAAIPAVLAQDAAPAGPVRGDGFHVDFVRLGPGGMNGLLYEPTAPGAHARTALVYTYPKAFFDATPAAQLAARGYRVLMARHYMGSRRGDVETPFDGVDETSRAIAFLRKQPGVERVIVMGWGAGARLATLYADVAAHGAAACTHPGVLVPCRAEQVTGLARPDGLVLFDPGLGALTTASDVDPAYAGDQRSRHDLDMYRPGNGYDMATGAAHYSAAFRQRFFAAQSARNNAIIDTALARTALVEQGKGRFADDEPYTVPGAVNAVHGGASLHRSDLSLLSHTKAPHLLLKPDGRDVQDVIRSIRSASGRQGAQDLGRCCDRENYGLHRFLTNDAVRTTPSFALTEDDILGVDWASSNTSTPVSATGVTVPTLLLTMSCFQFVVPGEIIFDHLAARDKTYAAVEGAGHDFAPCRAGFGDTRKRSFDFVDGWLAAPGRF